MRDDFRELLTLLRPFIPPALLDGAGWDNLVRRVGNLPGRDAANLVALELRLGDPDPAADVALAVGQGAPLRDFYVQRGETAAPGSVAAALGGLLARPPGPGWLEEGSIHSSDAVLEYDIAEVPAGACPEPGLFLALDNEGGLSRTPAELTAELSAVVGWDSPAVAQAVASVFDALPPGGRVATLGAMPDRAPWAIKLSIMSITHEEVGPFLERARWPGPVAEAVDILRDFRAVAPDFYLYMDIAASGPSPRLGLGLHAPDEGQAARPWRPILERLVQRGWCRPEKAEALLAFTGVQRVFHPQYSGTLYLGINHVKLTVGGDEVQAKAYAWFRLT